MLSSMVLSPPPPPSPLLFLSLSSSIVLFIFGVFLASLCLQKTRYFVVSRRKIRAAHESSDVMHSPRQHRGSSTEKKCGGDGSKTTEKKKKRSCNCKLLGCGSHAECIFKCASARAPRSIFFLCVCVCLYVGVCVYV